MKRRNVAFALAWSVLAAARAWDGPGHADDARTSAVERARAAIETNDSLRRLPYDALFASPFFLCREREPETHDAPTTARGTRTARAARILAEKARISTQVYEHILALYGERCGLRRLGDSVPGTANPSVPAATTGEAYPLVVWTFTAGESFTQFRASLLDEPLAAGVAWLLQRTTGRSFVYDEDGTDRGFEIQRDAGLAAITVLHAFARQRGDGARAEALPLFFETGLTEWLGAVTMAKDRSLTFVGIDRARLQILQQVKQRMSSANKKIFSFPLKELMQFASYGDVCDRGAQNWGADMSFVLSLFFIQSWEFIRFLDDAGDGKRRSAIGDLLDAWLGRAGAAGKRAAEDAERVLGIGSDADWARLEKDFAQYRLQLLRLDVDSLPRPPSLDDWPEYVPAVLEAK